MKLDDLLQRRGLPRADRLLVGAAATLPGADWTAFAAWLTAAQEHQLPRGEMEELLLQSVLFCGFPRAIDAFKVLGSAWPAASPPSGGGIAPENRFGEGQKLFRSIYAQHDATVRTMLRGHHQELHDFVLESAYGRILARPGLDAGRRELLALAQLAALDQASQFRAHAHGARNLGVAVAALNEMVTTACSVAGISRDRWAALLPGAAPA
ncbi:MAG: carboxymuconolactone decarboxylase family protein [Planctomycetota bacterium]